MVTLKGFNKSQRARDPNNTTRFEGVPSIEILDIEFDRDKWYSRDCMFVVYCDWIQYMYIEFTGEYLCENSAVCAEFQYATKTRIKYDIVCYITNCNRFLYKDIGRV